MGDILVRDVPQGIHREIQKKAASQNLSVNQFLIHWFKTNLEREDSEEEREQREAEAFRRIDEIRERNYRKYGLSKDSTRIIREWRDKRNQ